MSRHAREASLSAYTPSHMDTGMPHTRRPRMEMVHACTGAPAQVVRADIDSQEDAGTTTWLEPHPRERSVE
jgi:hypothetical protein